VLPPKLGVRCVVTTRGGPRRVRWTQEADPPFAPYRRRRRFTPSCSNDTSTLSRSAGSHWLGSVVHGRIEQLSGGQHDASERCRHVSFH
jgi:hypothetical protein